MFVAFALAASQSAVPVPPPPISPPIISVPVAPPVITPVGTYNRPTVTIRLRAISGQTVLIDDHYRVGRSSASFMQNRTDAAERPCAVSYNQTSRTSLGFTLRPEGPGPDSYKLTFNWSRTTGNCQEEGMRSVGIDQLVILKSGETVTVKGDGDVRVELTRLR